MHRYEEDLEEEAGYDDYYSGDDDDLEQEYEDEEEEEEEEEPPKEELEYLQLRQKLKDSIRKNMGKATSNAQSSQERRRKLPYNDFGSFFGPSRPVISSRVIQESKSLLENEIRTAKMSNSSQTMKRPVSTSSSAPRNVSHEKRPKVVNEVRRKVEALKDTRDYSFLLSDDAELPVPKKEQPPLSRSSSFPNSEARSAQLPARPKQSSGVNGRSAPREEKRPVPANGHSRPSSSGSQMNQRPASSGGSRSVSGRPASSGSQMQNSRPASSGSHLQQRAGPSGSQRPGSLTSRQAPPTRPGGSMVNSQPANRSGQLNSRSDSRRSAPLKVGVDHRRQMSSNGAGPGRPRALPTKASLERKPSMSGGKSCVEGAQRNCSSRPRMSSDPRQQRVMEQRKVSCRDPATSRMIPKQSAPASKHQMMSKRPPDHDIERRVVKKKKKPFEMSEDAKALLEIRKMFRTDRYAGRDDDDRNMEAGFEDIQKEERRSLRIANQEDAEEAAKILEAERRARLAKKRKLSR